ncbi:hypothetical protein [Nonomuraea sp. LPB2021202275-12-8]|uniref:hypothetical protein n=1 Tax=Nonomuraea sp. LPB2021202275-12-8 TaxID=3120159 RepID=UPI00300D08A3
MALAAPQIAQRLARTAWPPPLASALAGACVMLAADLVARAADPGRGAAGRRGDRRARCAPPAVAAGAGPPRLTSARSVAGREGGTCAMWSSAWATDQHPARCPAAQDVRKALRTPTKP